MKDSTRPDPAVCLPETADPDGPGLEHARVKALVRHALFGGDSVPLRIGRFTVLRRLGAGGMGVVYSGFDDDLERKVAIKLIRPDGRDPVAARTRLRREALAIARLSHPNVVPIFEVGEHRGEIYLAMEFVRGSTLRGWLAQGPRQWPAIRDVFVQAGRGLEAAHRAGIVHRDFKPDNVMVGDDGRVRVLDFGVAAVAEASSGEAEPIAGTPAYMAPEALRGLGADGRSDQFSFCVGLFEALYGHRPFATIEPSSNLSIPSTPALPSRFRAALARGLAVDPEARFATLDALLLELQHDPRTARRRWTMIGAVTLASVGGTVGIAVPLLLDDDRCSVADIDSVWSAERRSAAQSILTASEHPPSLPAWTSATAAIEAYVERWHASFEAACDAQGVDEELRLRQALCLQWAATDLGKVVESMFTGDGTTTETIPERMGRLFDPSLCHDPSAVAELTRQRALRTAPPPPGPASGLVSDFESKPLAAIGWGWAISNDAFVGGTSKVDFDVVEGGVHDEGHALRIAGRVGPGEPAWAGAMLFPGARVFAPANLQDKQRFSFWAIGDPGRYVVMLFTERTGFDAIEVEFSIGETWRRVDIDLEAALPERFDVTGLFIGTVDPGPFELRIDDVGLH